MAWCSRNVMNLNKHNNLHDILETGSCSDLVSRISDTIGK